MCVGYSDVSCMKWGLNDTHSTKGANVGYSGVIWMTLTTASFPTFGTSGLILSGLTPMLVVEAPYEWRWAAATTLLFVVVGNCMLFVGGYYYTPIDLAPSCAATLSGMTNVFAGLNGLLAPIVVAHMTPMVGYLPLTWLSPMVLQSLARATPSWA